MRIKHFKKRLFLPLAVILFVLGASFGAYASDVDHVVSDSAQNARDELEASIEGLEGSSDEYKEKLRNAMAVIDEEGYGAYTIMEGYEVIDNAMAQLNGGSWLEDLGAVAVGKLWKSEFKKLADSYSIDYTDETANDLADATKKVNLLTWDSGTGSNSGIVMDLLQNFDDNLSDFVDPICAIAVALTITFGCSGLMTMISDRNLSTEAINREFMKLIFGVWFIFNYKWFVLLIINFGTTLVSQVMTMWHPADQSYSLVQQCLYSSFNGIIVDYGDALFSFIVQSGTGLLSTNSGIQETPDLISTIASLIGGGIIQLSTSLVIYAVAIELGIRYFLTPLAIADLYSERFRSNGWMWLKKMFACAIQGVIIYLIVCGTEFLKTSVSSIDPITNTAINLTMLGMFAGSKQIARDIIGVH